MRLIKTLATCVAFTSIAVAEPLPLDEDLNKSLGLPKLIDTLEGLESKKLMSGASGRLPWSDSYWATYNGLIARRWADPNYPSSANSIENYNYVLANPPSTAVVETLSPAEKYDLLVGDANFTLTKKQWQQVTTRSGSGRIPKWIGLSHGWAFASIVFPDPRGSVDMMAVDGSTITFYPSDIKALASLLAAEDKPSTMFIGHRCNENNELACWDPNPAVWHLVATHRLGLQGKPMIVDLEMGPQVWNFPIRTYAYRYVNPVSGQQVFSLADAKVEVSGFAGDRFRHRRSSDAKWIVGIEMDVFYVDNVEPSVAPGQAVTKRVVYSYDLELDRSGRIVGGEWQKGPTDRIKFNRPDFIWFPEHDDQPFAQADELGTDGRAWKVGTPLPAAWREKALNMSAQNQPLEVVVRRLVELSQ